MLATTALLLTASTGCGFLEDTTDRADAARATHTPARVYSVPAAPTPDPDASRVLAEGDLLLAGGASGGHLVVTAFPVRTGSVPPVGGFSDACPVDWPSLQYVSLDFEFFGAPGGSAKNGLATHVSVARGAATPSDIGDVGVLVQSYVDDCADGGGLLTTDTFWNVMGHRTTGYVFLDGAVPAETPAGRSEVFGTLELRISELRFVPELGDERPLEVGPLTVGAACVDDAGAICVPVR